MDHIVTCEYCKSSVVERDMHCRNCGAPVDRESGGARDFRSCPLCHRKLLALASPACNYCGRRLPDDYIQAREADLKRITEVTEGETSSEVTRNERELYRESARRQRGRTSSELDITSLLDLFR